MHIGYMYLANINCKCFKHAVREKKLSKNSLLASVCSMYMGKVAV